MTDTKKFDVRITDLASRIYVNLVRDAASKPGAGAEWQKESERIARLSFALSAGFQRVLDDLNAENEPKNVGFTVQLDDIAGWSQPSEKS